MQHNKNVLIITSVGHALVHAITLIYPAIMIVLRDDFAVSLIQLGELGTIQFAFFGLGAFPAGWLVDRWGSRKVLIIYFGGLLCSIAIIVTAQSFISLAVGLGLLGLFCGLYHPAGLNLISQTKNLSRNMGYHGISGSIGLTIGPLIGGGIAALIDWRYAYLFTGIWALSGGIYTLKIIDNDRGSIPKKIKLFFKLKRVHYIIFAVSALWGFAHHGLFNFLPLFFSESIDWNIDPSIRGGILTAFVLILGVIGQLTGGKLGAKIPRKKLLVWVVGLNIPFMILMGFTDGILLILIVGILGAVNFTYQPVNNSLIADVTSKENRGMVYGLSSGFGFGVGSFAATSGGYIGELLQLNYIFPLLSLVLIPAVILSLLIFNDK